MLVLDCSTMECPQPVVFTKENIDKHAPEALEILVSNKAAVENVSRFLKNIGYNVEMEEKSVSEANPLYLLKAQNGSVQNKTERQIISQDIEDKKKLILLTSDLIGTGDDELGEKLMASFISCLKEIEPWCIIMLNGGVRLSTKEGDILKHLKDLEISGTKILVCGSCLTHYGLYDEKRIGETTNMLDVITALDFADKIIKP